MAPATHRPWLDSGDLKNNAALGRVSVVLIVAVVLLCGIAFGYAISANISAPVSTKTTTLTTTFTTTANFSPFNGNNNGTWYMSYPAGSGGCGAYDGTDTPCWSALVNDSYVFNCLAQASTEAGCTRTVVSPSSPDVFNYTVTIWYPPSNQTLNATNTFPYYASLANCIYGVAIETMYATGPVYHEQSLYAYCLPLNQTAFIVTQPDDGQPHG